MRRSQPAMPPSSGGRLALSLARADASQERRMQAAVEAFAARQGRRRPAELARCEWPSVAQQTASCVGASVLDSQLPYNNSCGLDFIECGAGAVDFVEDLSTFGLPGVRLRIGIALGEIGLDVAHEFADRREAAGADDVVCRDRRRSARQGSSMTMRSA